MSSLQAVVVLLLCTREATAAASLMNTSHCYNFTDNEVQVAIILRSGLSFLSFMISIPIVALRVTQMCTQREAVKHTDRLIVYISMATMLYASAQSLQWFHLYKDEPTFCIALAAVTEYVSLLVLVATACVGCHLLLLICQTRCLKVTPPGGTGTYKMQEAAYLLLAALLPLLFVPWPFLYDLYGDSGVWCWIRSTDHNCMLVERGVVLSIVLYYMWAAVLLPCTFIVTLAVLVILLCLRRAQRPHPSMYSLLGYMSVFISTTVASGIGGSLLLRYPNVYGYLLIQTLSEPAFTTLSIVVVLIQTCWSHHHNKSVYGHYRQASISSYSAI